MTSAEASLKSRATRRVFIAIEQWKSGRLKEDYTVAIVRLCLAVDLAIVERLAFADSHSIRLAVEFLKETAVVSGVAGAAGLLDLEEENVAVAVRKPALDLLRVAAGFALEPQLFS